MFEPITLDQLRAFVTIVEGGQLSAAARKLRRVQSAISKSMANLEQQLGITLLDRSTKKTAKLSDPGNVVLAAARRVLLEMNMLKHVTAGMALGIEPRSRSASTRCSLSRSWSNCVRDSPRRCRWSTSGSTRSSCPWCPPAS